MFRLKTALILLCFSLAAVGSLSFISLSARALEEATVEKASGSPVVVEGDELTKTPFLKTAARFARYELPPLPVLLMSDGRAMVPAQRIWSDTGVNLREGQIVSVSASGQVRGCSQPPTSWAFGPWGPEGTLCGEPEDADKKACALIGKIEAGGDQREFYIGKELTFKAPLAGTFYLGVADLFHMDNEAAFVAEVKVAGETVNFGRGGTGFSRQGGMNHGQDAHATSPGSGVERGHASSGETDAGSPSPGDSDGESPSSDINKLLSGKRVFRGTYNHRSRGQPYGTSEQWVVEDDQGALTVVTKLRSDTYVATGDRNHRVIEYKILPEEEAGYRLEMTIREGKVTYKQRMPGEEEKTFETPVPDGSLFDPNTRPDPYCATVILLKHLAPKEGESKESLAYDRDNAGVGMATYRFRIENRGKEEVNVPAGKFETNHLVLTQLTTGDTWYKKAAMHVTDFWVLENGVIVKILRHREPYEVELQLVQEADPSFWLQRPVAGAVPAPARPPSRLQVTIPRQPVRVSEPPGISSGLKMRPEAGQDYAARADGFRAGELYYTDRIYRLTGVPEKYRGLTYIRTLQDDKYATRDFVLPLEIGAPAMVYVAHDDRVESKPVWLRAFEDTGDDVATDDPWEPVYSVYAKPYPRGTVLLGPNGADLQSNTAMYVAILAQLAPPYAEPLVLATSDKIEGEPPLKVQFNTTLLATDRTAESWTWDFGDGTAKSNEQNPEHTYAKAGTYLAAVIVQDSAGDASSARVGIQVLAEGTDVTTLTATIPVVRPAAAPGSRAPAPGQVPEGYATGTNGVRFMKTLPVYKRQELPPAPVLVMDDGRAIVPAQRIWSDSGLDVAEGQSIVFSADGQVRSCHAPMGDWAMGPWGPEGTLAPGMPYEGNRVCALIGKIEGADTVGEFYIGKELTLEAPSSGKLYLGVSDIFHLDNEGAFVVAAELDGKRIDFKAIHPSAPAAKGVKPEVLVSVRPPAATVATKQGFFIDLDPYITTYLKNWHGVPGNDLAIEPGTHRLGDTEFEIGQGAIEVAGKFTSAIRRPKTEGIEVGRRFNRLHILHGTAWGAGGPQFAVPEGTHVASYMIHYGDGLTEEVAVRYGVHVRDWWARPGDSSDVSEGTVAWTGENGHARERAGATTRLYSMTWTNPHPERLVTTIDFVSTETVCGPFVVAMTAETEGPVPTGDTKEVRPGPVPEKGYERAFRDLYEELGRNYPAFGIKGIDWSKVGEELLPRAKEVKTDQEFGLLCMELVTRLEDSHAYLMNGTAQVPSVEFPRYDPGFACLIDDRGKPVVYYVDKGGPADTAGVRVGMTVVSINGEDAGERMQKRMKETKKYSGYSSDRYLLYHAAQWLGRQVERGAEVEMQMQDVEGKIHTFKCPATYDVRYLPRRPVPTPGISDSANVSWAMLGNDIGLIYVRRIGDDLIPRLDQAVEPLKNARGLIVDVRGNSGGGFDASRALLNFSLDDGLEPQRPRFKGPVALLIDARCISAGEGWASWFVAHKRAKVFGETTAGASSRKTVYTLPNGLFKVQYPVKAYTGFLDRPIERKGLEPDVPVRQNAKDLAAGRDTVVEAARRYLLEQTPGYAAAVAPAAAEVIAAVVEANAEEYRPPDFEGYFPDDPEGGQKLDAMGEDGVFQSSLPDGELLEIVRKGLRRTRQRWILRALGNRYIWGKYPQNQKAIELMYHATGGPQMYNAGYFGLSVVVDKSPSILRALADICMRSDDPNVLSRVAWGTQSQTSEILAYLAPYLSSTDQKTQEKARIVEKILTGELKAFAWAAEQARVRAEQFRDKLPEVKEKLLNGDSVTRREALNYIATTGITLIMDDSFIEAWKACGTDPDARIRNDVACTFGNHWIWGAPEQKPEAIELMLQLSRDEVREVRYNSVYFGLSTVRDKSEAVVTRLLEIALDDREGNMSYRIQWGLSESKALAAKVLESYMDQNDSNPQKGRAAFEIYKDIVGADPPRPERFQR